MNYNKYNTCSLNNNYICKKSCNSKKIIILKGKVQSGFEWSSKGLNSMLIELFYVSNFETILVTQTISDINGYFYLNFNKIKLANNNNCCDNIYESFYYIMATQTNNLKNKLMLIIGDISEAQEDIYIINERSTIAGIYCASRFYNKDDNKIKIKENNLALKIISKMNLNLIKYNGSLSEVIKFSPNGDETNSMRLLNSLSNLLGAIINDDTSDKFNICSSLTKINNILPKNTIEIFLNIVLEPGNNVTSIFNETLNINKFIYGFYLTQYQQPDCLCIAVKVNNTGNDNYLFGGPANLIFDKSGNAWITNNVIQGTVNSSNFDIVLDAAGKPSSGKNGNPPSLLFGGGILGSAFGIDIDYKKKNVLLSIFGWGESLPEKGGIAKFNLNGVPLSDPIGIIKDTYRVQGIKVDRKNNIWIASNGNDRIVVYLNGDPNNSIFYQFEEGSNPFDLDLDKNDDYVVLSNSGDENVNSSIVKLKIENNTIVPIFTTKVGNKIIGIGINSKDEIFVASSLNSSVYKLSPNGVILKQIIDSSIITPWSVSIDGNDDVWVANFDLILERQYGISKLDSEGNVLAPPTGFNILSGGSQVLLHNGLPLYYPLNELSFNPLMRLTSARIDGAGNIWAINNWKPPFYQDVELNPGGDGIIIFLGLATPYNK